LEEGHSINKISKEKYTSLLQDYVSKTIDANEFESKFLKLFKSDESFRPQKEFDILDRLFSDVDAYCKDPELLRKLDPRFNIGEAELRKRAERALLELKSLQ
jgi:Bacterial self-protective colicin-like immunity